jgi:hypothetical protein
VRVRRKGRGRRKRWRLLGCDVGLVGALDWSLILWLRRRGHGSREQLGLRFHWRIFYGI